MAFKKPSFFLFISNVDNFKHYFNRLKDFSNKQLLKLCESLEEEMSFVNVENEILISYLRRIGDDLFTELDKYQDINSIPPNRLKEIKELLKSEADTSNEEVVIPISTKIDIVEKELSHLKKMFELKKSTLKEKLLLLSAEIKETKDRINKIAETQKRFEEMVYVPKNSEAVDQLRAKKFIKFLYEYLRKSGQEFSKLKLETSNLKIKYNKFINNEGHGESEQVLPVHLELMRIKHEILNSQMRQTNKDFCRVKRNAGEKHRKLEVLEKEVSRKLQMLSKIQYENMKNKEMLINVEAKREEVLNDIVKLSSKASKNKKILERMQNNIPDVYDDYIEKKYKLSKLENELKSWHHRLNVKARELFKCRRNKELSGCQSEAIPMKSPEHAGKSICVAAATGKLKDTNLRSHRYDIQQLEDMFM